MTMTHAESQRRYRETHPEYAERHREEQRRYREAHPERWQDIHRASRAKNRDAANAYIGKYNKEHPERRTAHHAVSNGVRHGTLLRGPCEICGGELVEGHHDDYGKPLDVRWLCPLHHSQLHRALKGAGDE